MELVLTVVALVLAVAALALALLLRDQARGARAAASAAQRALEVAQTSVEAAVREQRVLADALERLRAELADLRGQVEHASRELAEMRAVAATPPPPPLPKPQARTLDELREQLRAARLQASDDEDDL